MIAPRNGVHIVAETDHYQLLDLDNDDSRFAFRQIKLVSKQPMHKANWWRGWNGERLARNQDACLLYENNPEVFEWVVSTLTEFTKPFRNCIEKRSPAWDSWTGYTRL